MAKTFEEWRRLVGGTTVTKSTADADAIAAALVENPESCVWHEHAKFYGFPCGCSACTRIGRVFRRGVCVAAIYRARP